MKKVKSRGNAQAKSNTPNKSAMGGGTYGYTTPKGNPKSRGNAQAKSNTYTGGKPYNFEA